MRSGSCRSQRGDKRKLLQLAVGSAQILGLPLEDQFSLLAGAEIEIDAGPAKRAALGVENGNAAGHDVVILAVDAEAVMFHVLHMPPLWTRSCHAATGVFVIVRMQHFGPAVGRVFRLREADQFQERLARIGVA